MNSDRSEVIADLAPAEPSKQVTDVDLLGALVGKAAAAPPSERRKLADQIGAVLREMGRSEPSRGAADLLLAQLESGTLSELVDSKGRSCRALAVEALISMGFPYALEVSPEDLEHLRAEKGKGKVLPAATSLGMVLVAAAANLPSLLSAQGDRSGFLPVMLMLGATLAAALIQPGTQGQRWVAGALLVASLWGVGLAMLGSGAMWLTGAVSLIAWWLMRESR